jgi:hypothetical protein
MATCPDCDGKGYRLIVNPISDPSDPQPSIYQIPLWCGRCNRTRSVSNGQTGPPSQVIPESLDEKLTRWTMVVLAMCIFAVIVLVVLWPFGR